MIDGADLLIGVSGARALPAEASLGWTTRDGLRDGQSHPRGAPEEAAPYVRIMATGRSDYPSQINNVLCFPGIFRGALDVRAPDITEQMKMAAAHAIAEIVEDTSCARTTSSPRSSIARWLPPWRLRSPRGPRRRHRARGPGGRLRPGRHDDRGLDRAGQRRPRVTGRARGVSAAGWG